MHLSQVWLISLLDGLCKAMWCTLDSPSMKGATLTVNKSERYPLLPSLNLQTQLYLGSSNWLDISNTAEMFLNLTLSLIHPELFNCRLLMLQKLWQLETTKDVAWKWQSVYTGIAIISNRATPAHWNSKGRPEWFDLLLNYSSIGNRAQLLVKDLGLTLEYSTGTIVGFVDQSFSIRWGLGEAAIGSVMRISCGSRLGSTWMFLQESGWTTVCTIQSNRVARAQTTESFHHIRNLKMLFNLEY